MRIDKYLKNSRIIKRRTVAKSACDKGLIKINEKIAKAGAEVEIGDIIEIMLGNKEILVKVLSVNDNVSKDDASSIYERIN